MQALKERLYDLKACDHLHVAQAVEWLRYSGGRGFRLSLAATPAVCTSGSWRLWAEHLRAQRTPRAAHRRRTRFLMMEIVTTPQTSNYRRCPADRARPTPDEAELQDLSLEVLLQYLNPVEVLRQPE